jgi:hypothetical protein
MQLRTILILHFTGLRVGSFLHSNLKSHFYESPQLSNTTSTAERNPDPGLSYNYCIETTADILLKMPAWGGDGPGGKGPPAGWNGGPRGMGAKHAV